MSKLFNSFVLLNYRFSWCPIALTLIYLCTVIKIVGIQLLNQYKEFKVIFFFFQLYMFKFSLFEV